MSKPAQFAGFPAELDPGYGPYRGACDRVVDGDTIYALIDLGLSQYAYVALRLEGYDAPEVFSGTAEERRRGRLTTAELARVVPPGAHFRADTIKDSRTFNRYRAFLYLADGTDVTSHMDEWIRRQAEIGWPA